MTDTRAEFEAAYIAHLKQQWPLNKCTPQDLAVMREGDGYGDGASHLAGAWWGWRAASVLGGEVVAWRYLTPTGWHATTDLDRALGASAHHDMEPLYAHPAPSAPAQALLASKPAVALGEELRSMLTRAYNAGWDASDACDNAYNNGNSERLETEIPQAHEPAVYQRWRATWFSNRDEVLRAIAASAAPAQSCGDAATGIAEADRIINRLLSSDPQFDDCSDAVDLIRKLIRDHRETTTELRAAEQADETVTDSEPVDIDLIMTRIPTVARLYYTGIGSRRYRRASTQTGPGEPLVHRSHVERELQILQAEFHHAARAKDRK